ncbi:MAG: MaoC family dehydratase [Pseudohongiellaceae bacterium]
MTGKYFEELELGAVFEHQVHRTVTESDNLQFSTMTHNPQPLHIDAEFAKTTQFGQILVNSYFTLGLVVGLSVGDTTMGTTIGNLGMEKVEFPNPVFIGDTLRVQTKIVDKRESKTKPDRGIVWFEHLGINQRGEVVCECLRKGMMLRLPT